MASEAPQLRCRARLRVWLIYLLISGSTLTVRRLHLGASALRRTDFNIWKTYPPCALDQVRSVLVLRLCICGCVPNRLQSDAVASVA